jgi:hypothetical protein
VRFLQGRGFALDDVLHFLRTVSHREGRR